MLLDDDAAGATGVVIYVGDGIEVLIWQAGGGGCGVVVVVDVVVLVCKHRIGP